MGINLGAFLSPLVCGTLGQTLGWRYGFMAAGVGMIAGLCLYLWGQKHLAADTLVRTKGQQAVKQPLTPDEWKRVGALIVLCA
jgi:POT family proton-dependent oligopeptide transporter